MQPPKPIALIILDGWGYSEISENNAITAANTPNWDTWWQDYPHSFLDVSGVDAGLPDKQMGNSEVGHLNMGAGRIVYQDLTRIEQSLRENTFQKNPIFLKTLEDVKKSGKTLHLIGLLSPGGVHSHESHFHELLKMAAQQGLTSVCIHAFLDGRDVPPRSAEPSLKGLETLCETLQCGKITSVTGRYFAMDRDKRWDRTQRAYELLTEGKGFTAENALDALHQAYARNENDEFVQPTAIGAPGAAFLRIKDGDSVIFVNFRADRARQLTRAFLEEPFSGFKRIQRPKLQHFVSLTEYAKELPTEIAFPPEPLQNILGAYLAAQGLTQLRIAETEKYAHVTFFFNGGIEPPFPGEERLLIHSPQVATYDLHPEMSAYALTDALVDAIHTGKYDFIVCNFANADMVGHSGNFDATVKAIETLDCCLGRIINTLRQVGGEALLTADHGNAECLYDSNTEQAHTAHTHNPVPFLYIGNRAEITHNPGKLCDIAPTVLALLGLKIPKEMTGKSLLKLTKLQ